MPPEVLPLDRLKIKIFADGADLADIRRVASNPLIKGITTNPTLMRQAGVSDYRDFARQLLEAIPQLPVSFEVFAERFEEMEAQALEIASWASNVYVKIPVTDVHGVFSGELIQRLVQRKVQLNITALMTLEQVDRVARVLTAEVPAFVSVFAGRIADTGRDPMPLMAEAVRILAALPRAELIWASPRELLNIYHAEQVGCHIITVTHDILKKAVNIGRDLADYSLDTVKMFDGDARRAGYAISIGDKLHA